MYKHYWNEELETKPWNEVQDWQSTKISEFVSALSSRSKFYHKHLSNIETKEVKTFKHLSDLPFTSKQDIKGTQSELTLAEPFGLNQAATQEEVIQGVCSSGTTGSPMYYALTRKDWEVWSDGIANTFYTAGIRPDDIIAHLVGLPMVAGGLPYADGFRKIGATLCWLGGFPKERILREMDHLNVTSMLSTTSFGTYLAEELLSGCSGTPEIKLKKFLSGGEPGLAQPEIRQKIEQGLKTKHIREIMGLGDVMSAMWSECEMQDGMHFNAQRYVAIELIDPDTGGILQMDDGAIGEVVYTTFEREATPMLRYRSQDHMQLMSNDCACGRTSPKFRCVGRTDDMIIYKGMNVFPTAIREFVATNFNENIEPKLRIRKDHASQVKFDDPIPLEFEAKSKLPGNNYSGLANDISNMIRQHLQVRTTVKILSPGSFPRSDYKTPIFYVHETKS